MTQRELNRATLARQLLLERAELGAEEAVARLAGLQAQDVPPPYIALWSRLRRFERQELTELCTSRRVVRASLMRHTVHVLGARDYLRLHTAIHPGLARSWKSQVAKRLDGVAVDDVVRAAEDFVRAAPRRWSEVQAHLAELMPHADERALAYTARTFVRMVRVTDGDSWAYSGNARFTLVEDWLGEAPSEQDDARELVRRYLAAFGPAAPADASVWSGRSGLAPVFEALRPELVTFRDENGRELFDLPEAPRPPADTPAPARLLPLYDNLVLSHRDRTRVVTEEYRPRIQIRVGQLLSAFLVDGFVAGTWTRDRRTGAISIEPFHRLPRRELAALREEADRLTEFLRD